MPPFDAASICPKCGHDKVNTVYQESRHPSCDDFCRDKLPERLERWCDRCRYRWAEACIDAASPDAPETGG